MNQINNLSVAIISIISTFLFFIYMGVSDIAKNEMCEDFKNYESELISESITYKKYCLKEK